MKCIYLVFLLSCSLLVLPGECEEVDQVLPFYPYIPANPGGRHNMYDFSLRNVVKIVGATCLAGNNIAK